jgi:demethylmenaquinone methyltransferase / 2-methoxy-6-polyprenyl-1,4-benzoquinol methylase
MEHTHFGYQAVPVEEKEARVGDVFRSVAPHYDIMNDLMSGGLHRWWKRQLIGMMHPRPGAHLLDVAGGTGDIAFRFLKYAPKSHVTLCDINQKMLQAGQKNAFDRNILAGIDWVCGNAESLPLPSSTYDYYTIAFGIRNVTHIEDALTEAYRVLKPGGRFLCLEFSHVAQPWLAELYDAYSFRVIPLLGKYVAKDEASYRYLVESIRMFPTQEAFVEKIRKVGFDNVRYTNMTQGVVAIHSGWKL